MPPLHRLTADGVRQFEIYLDRGASGPAPLDAISRSGGAIVAESAIEVRAQGFATRLELGGYLHEALQALGRETVAHDPGLWNWLALLFFDPICPPRPDGSRRVPGR